MEWMFFKYFVKMWIAVYLVSHTFDIAMAVFDIGQSVVNSSSGIIRGNTAIDISSLSMQMQAAMATMAIGELVTLALETLVVSWCLKILSVVITVIMYGRMIEIYLYTSLAPIPFATILQSGMTTKDFIAPTSFLFKSGKDFMMGDTYGAASYLNILAPELTDKVLAEFLDIPNGVNRPQIREASLITDKFGLKKDSCQCHEPSCLIPICTKNSPSPCGNGEHKSYIILSVYLTECTSQLNRWFSGGLRLTQTQPYIIPV